MINYFIDQHKITSYTPADMANTKSAIKRIRRISAQTKVNKARKNKYRNALKKMSILIKDKKTDLKNLKFCHLVQVLVILKRLNTIFMG